SAALIPGTMNPDAIHPFGIGGNSSQPGTVGSIGYSEVVRPGSQLKAKSQTVMVISGDTPIYYPYWRGIALAGRGRISWYEPPSPNPSLVNVAGDSGSLATFDTIDRIRFAKRLAPPYNYSVTEAIPNVDVQDLQNAGTDYPAWLAPYATLYAAGRVAPGYSTARDSEIETLARSIVRAAGATTPYDQSKAVESCFLAKGRFTYTLKPPLARPGERPLDFFLFTSRKGFCQDFSTA